jgi:flagellar hook-basal body complex protein FliE
MNNLNNISSLSTADLLNKKSGINNAAQESSSSFADTLNSALGNVNQAQEVSEKAMSDLATGQVKDLHQAAISIDKAEMSMKFMLEVRNKALSAYKEITRTQM